MIVLPDTWVARLGNENLFDKLFSLQGRILREQEGRKTVHFTFEGKTYYGKFHSGVGWREIFKNISQFRLPVLGAQNEWKAIQGLKRLGLKSMDIVGFGKRGINPARIQSFVITEELAGTISLENFCRDWEESPPENKLKRGLLAETARIARIMHGNGINHRDFYLCHLLFDINAKGDEEAAPAPSLYLIDLHRAQIRKKTPRRWIIKDLAALYFSSMDIGLTRNDIFRFVKLYTGKTLRKALKHDQKMWRKVIKRAESLYWKTWEKPPVHPCLKEG